MGVEATGVEVGFEGMSVEVKMPTGERNPPTLINATLNALLLLMMKKGGQLIYIGPLGPLSQHMIQYVEAIPGVPRIQKDQNPAAWMMDITSPIMEYKLTTEQSVFHILGLMYGSALFLGFINATIVQPIVCTERNVFYRERSAGMSSSVPYVVAQVAIEIPYIVMQVLIFFKCCIPNGSISVNNLQVLMVYVLHELKSRLLHTFRHDRRPDTYSRHSCLILLPHIHSMEHLFWLHHPKNDDSSMVETIRPTLLRGQSMVLRLLSWGTATT